MGERILFKLVRLYGELSDIVTHPHGLRHAGITAALDLNLPTRSVQMFARYASPATLRFYERNREDLAGGVAASVADDIAKLTA